MKGADWPRPPSSSSSSSSSWLALSMVRFVAVLLVFSLGFLVNEFELFRLTASSSSTIPSAPTSHPLTPSPTPAPTPLFDRTAIAAARAAAVELRAELLERAPRRDARIFARTMPLTGSEHVLAAKYAHAMTKRQPFVVGVLGTSNAACYDNDRSACFPTHFADGLAPLLAPMAVRVELRNHAIGSVSSIVPAMCFDTLLGDDVDVVLFEFFMTDAGLHCVPLSHETLVRRALQMPKQPTVTFVEIEGGRHPGDEPRTPNVGERDLHTDPNTHRDLRRHYAAFDVHHMEMHDGLYTVDHVEGWRYEDLFVTWHPGPRGHRFIADQLLFYHVAAFLIALDLLEDLPTAYVVPRRRALPPPRFCGAWCSDEQPDCFTSFQPLQRTNKTLGHAMHLPNPPPLIATDEEAQLLSFANLTSAAFEWQRVLLAHELSRKEHAYIDFKAQWFARGGAGAREFFVRVPLDGVGVAVLCQAPPFWGADDDNHAPLSSADDIRYAVDGVEAAPRNDTELGGLGLCGHEWPDICIALGTNLTAGMHVVSVEPLTNKYVLLAHVIGL